MKSLKTILEKYSHIDLCEASDNEEILKFLKDISMEVNGINLRYERKPDFFALLAMQAPTNFVFKFLNKDGSIGGLATLCINRHYYNGSAMKVAYLGDLRTSGQLYSRARVQWRACYDEIIRSYREINDFGGCQFLYTAVLDENVAATNALVANEKSSFIYRKLMSYKGINIFGRLKYPKLNHSNEIRIRRARLKDLLAINKFLQVQNQRKVFGYHFCLGSGNELLRRIQKWPEFNVSSFRIAEDHQGRFLGCVAPWSSKGTRSIVAEKLNWRLRVLGQSLPVFGKRSLKERQEIEVLYLTHFEICDRLDARQKTQVFLQLIDCVYDERGRDFHLLSLLDFDGSSLGKSLKSHGYMTFDIPGTLYQVASRRDDEAAKHQVCMDQNEVGFELGVA